MAIAVVQRAIGVDPNGSLGAVAATLLSTNTAGNAIIACVTMAATSPAGEGVPTDTQGNTYTLLTTFSNGTSFNSQAWYACYNIAGHAAGNVITSNPDVGAVNMHVWEVSGLVTTAAFDKSSSTFGSTTSLTSGATATTTVADELLIGVFSNDHLNESWTLGAGYSNLLISGATQTNAFSSASEEQIVAATGAYTATMTAGHAAANLGVIMTFKGLSTSTIFPSQYIRRDNPLRSRVPKRQQVSRAKVLPPLGSQAPYLSYWKSKVNQPPRNRTSKRQQPIVNEGWISKFITPTITPIVSSWAEPISQPIRARIPKRQQPVKARPPFPPLPSAAPYISYWVNRRSQPLKNSIKRRQQPQPFEGAYWTSADGLQTASFMSWKQKVNEPMKNRTPKRQQPQRKPGTHWFIYPVLFTIFGWMPKTQQFLRKRVLKRQQPDYAKERVYIVIPNPAPPAAIGIIIDSTLTNDTFNDTNMTGSLNSDSNADTLNSVNQNATLNEDSSNLTIDSTNTNTDLEG